MSRSAIHKKIVFGFFPEFGPGEDLVELGRYRQTVAGQIIETHKHDRTRLELCWVLDGTLVCSINERPYVVMPGHGLAVKPNEIHNDRNTTQPRGEIGYLSNSFRWSRRSPPITNIGLTVEDDRLQAMESDSFSIC